MWWTHDDVIKWKHFRRYWPFVQGIHRSAGPVTRSFDVFFDLRPNKRLSKQSWGWWFEMLSCSLWRHCNELIETPLLRCNVIYYWWTIMGMATWYSKLIDICIYQCISALLNSITIVRMGVGRGNECVFINCCEGMDGQFITQNAHKKATAHAILWDLSAIYPHRLKTDMGKDWK